MITSTLQSKNADTRKLKLLQLRQEMKHLNIDAFLIPVADPYQSFPIAEHDQRLKWLTGFSGSAGLAIIGNSTAALLVDGRYTIQAVEQTNQEYFEVVNFIEPSAEGLSGIPNHLNTWANKHLPQKASIGIDPCLHGDQSVSKLKSVMRPRAIQLVTNPIDKIWKDQPPSPASEMFEHNIAFAGQSRESKLHNLSVFLKEKEIDSVIITSSENIAWLLNIRGADVVQNPIKHAFAIVNQDSSVMLFIDTPLTTNQNYTWLGNQINIFPIKDFVKAITSLKGRVLAANEANHWVIHQLSKAAIQLCRGSDPCELPKAQKNTVQIKGFIDSHIRDGVAMVEFLCWLDSVPYPNQMNEIDAAEQLLKFRQSSGCLHDISFDTISSVGSNGAIIHYCVTPESNRYFSDGDLYLVDSGGQYVDGTTDVTRTIPIGEVAHKYFKIYSCVLCSLIALSSARWSSTRKGCELDMIARKSMQHHKLDYPHGTGHGVGHFLAVHEGPANIAPQSQEILREGMVMSIEPGCYIQNHFGIRLENLAVVKACNDANENQEHHLEFQTLTLVPFDRRLIDASLLSPDELNWLNNYHADVWEKLNHRCSENTRQWLKSACAPLN